MMEQGDSRGNCMLKVQGTRYDDGHVDSCGMLAEVVPNETAAHAQACAARCSACVTE